MGLFNSEMLCKSQNHQKASTDSVFLLLVLRLFFLMNLQQQDILQRLQEIDAYEFEEFVADLWTKQGWETYVTTGANDRGVDVFAEQSTPYPQKQAIQVKRYDPDNSVGRPDIQQYASIPQEQTDIDSVIVVTTGTFTDKAQVAAQNLNVKLIDGARLYNLIDALEAFELVESYLGPDFGEASPVGEGVDTSASQSSSRTTSSFLNGDGKDKEVNNVPRTVPALLTVRAELTSKLTQLESKLENAEQAIEEDDYRTAVEYYQKAGELRAESQQGIAQYDAGLTSVDSGTAEQLPPTETFLNRLELLEEQLHQHAGEAIHIAERIQGLKQLVSELEEHADTITESLSKGDQVLNEGGETFERAASWYQEAEDRLTQLQETKEIYEGLTAKYDAVIVENHAGLPESFSVPELESEVEKRLNSRSTYEDLEAISEGAIGSFEANVLTTSDGTLFEKELYEYVPDEETLQFVFEPPRRGFTIAEPGSSATPFHDDPFAAGSSFLLITDQRILYVAGVDDHDRVVSLPFADIDEVTATVNASTHTLSISVSGGKRYEIDGLRNYSSDIEPAANYINRETE